MGNDPLADVGLVAREVRTTERNGTPTRVVIARRDYATNQADLWDALTNADRLPRWFFPVSGDLELGGQYQIEGNASGTIDACEEPDSFSMTWVYGGSTSWVTVKLDADGDNTTLELLHEAPVFPWFWEKYGPGATGIGWELAFIALEHHISTGEVFGPDDQAAFCGSPDGIAALEASAVGWGDAAIADGDEPVEARAAAGASSDFFADRGHF